MTMPSDADLRQMSYEDLVALAETDPDLDVTAAIARARELSARPPSIADLRGPRSQAPDPTKRPIAAQRAAIVAAHATTPAGRHLAALRENGTRS